MAATSSRFAEDGTTQLTFAGGAVARVPSVAIVPAPAVALSSPPANLTAGADTSLTFASEIHHLLIQNNGAVTVGVEFDATASAGSLQVAAGQTLLLDLPLTVLHCYSASAPAVNGTAAGNLVVKGWA
jgi:hypothetical protein